MTEVGLIGAAGVGRRCADILKQKGANLVGVFDDDPGVIEYSRLQSRNIAYLGTVSELLSTVRSLAIVVGIGSPRVREAIKNRLLAAGYDNFPSLIDRRAHFGSDIEVGRGVVVCSGVEISTNCELGDFTQINPGAILGHDVRLGETVSVNPGAIISGDVSVGDLATIGAGAVILQGLSIGTGAIVGAGSVVTKDVPAFATVMGSPAK